MPMGLAAGSTVNLKSRTGGTISFSMPEMGVGGAGAGAEAESATAALSPMDRAAALKAEGNELFGAMEWVLASKAYLQATRVLAKDRSGAAAELLGACWLNLGACHLRLEQPAEAVEACDQSLAQRRSAKGLYRRALARQLLAAQEGPDAGSTLALAVADAAAAVALGDTKDAATRQLVVDLRAAAAAAAAAAPGATLAAAPRAAADLAPERDGASTAPAPALPGISAFFADDAVPVQLHCTQELGRHLIVKRSIPAGGIVLAADAYVVIPAPPSAASSAAGAGAVEVCTEADSRLTSTVQARLEQLQFSNDDDSELVSEVLQTADTIANRRSSKDDRNIRQMELQGDKESLKLAGKVLTQSAEDERAEEEAAEYKKQRGVHYKLSYQDVADLLSHREYLRKQPDGWAALHSSAQLVRRALGPTPAAAPTDSVLGSLTPDDVADVLLRIKYNAHPIHDAASHTRKVGLGLFPAACYINHGCSANVVYCHVNQGRTIVFRALRPIAAGEHVVYSYIDPYQTVEERRKLLRDAFLITPLAGMSANASGIGRPTDHLIVAASGDGPKLRPAPERAAKMVEERMQRGILMMADPQAAMRCLLQLSEDSCIRQLHSSHRLMFELSLALVSTSSLVGVSAAPVRVEWSLKAIQAMEAVLDVGTPQLASLYASHSAGLLQIIRHQPPADARGLLAMSKQCVATLNAAASIRTVCYGEHDALSTTTRKAVAKTTRELNLGD